MQDTTKRLLTFIDKSKSMYHAIANIEEILSEHGYEELREHDEFHLVPGGRYYVTRNDSTIAAFELPKGDIEGFHIIAAHSDSPTFKVKENPEMSSEGYIRLNTEKYGGMIMNSWFDRPLSVAGRIAVKENGKIVTKLVDVDRDLLVIPNVAIHMNREVNNGMKYDASIDTVPLFAETPETASGMSSTKNLVANTQNCMDDGGEDNSEKKGTTRRPSVISEVAKSAGVLEEQILGHDLFLYVREKGRLIGANEEYILSPKLDDLQCAFAAVEALTQSTPDKYINVAVIFDNEEVGSGTRQGADSTFLEDLMTRIRESFGKNKSWLIRMISDSFMISADNAHAVHPNHPEHSDMNNRPYMNRGIVLKYHGAQKYTTDAFSAARIRDLCKRAEVPCQVFTNKSNKIGGSTLGNISQAHISIASADIGLPQLAMHSAVETGGVRDTEYAVKMFGEFYRE